MTNLEYYKDEINEYIEKNRDIYVYDAIANGFKEFSKKYINNYPNNPLKFIDWLLQERKELIKLKQWEKDLLTVFMEFADIQGKHITLNNALLISPMLRKGHFKGVTDTTMKLSEILDSCEVVE